VLRPSVEEFEELSIHQLKYRMGKSTCSFSQKEIDLWRDSVNWLRYLRPQWVKAKELKRKVIAAFTREAYRQERQGRIAIPISPRLNEGVTNLAEALAKAAGRVEVWMRDVLRAIQLIVNSLIPCGLNEDDVTKRMVEVLKTHA